MPRAISCIGLVVAASVAPIRRSSAISSGWRRSSASGRTRAAEYFSRNAASWDQIRSLHAPDRAVEAALLKLVGKRPFQSMLDLGTGTGRLLEIFAPLYRRGVGIDMSREMLAVARANLDKAGVANAQVRQGDIFAPPVERDAFDLVTIHQVLHYLDDPAPRHPRGGAAAAARPAGWSSSISRRMRWNSCATSMRICGSAFPTGRSPNGLPRPASTSRRARSSSRAAATRPG